MITIIDYGVGNLSSIQNMLKKCAVESTITNEASKIKSASKIILPGVGAFDSAMQRLNELDLVDIIKERASEGVPFLGICLGAQLLMNGSEEGNLSGLGLIAGYCRKFNAQEIAPLRIPNIGWSDVIFRKHHHLNSFTLEIPRFYFVHSYHIVCNNPEDILAVARYGLEFTCAINHKNISGVQFHPEKSHKFGWQLLSNFANN